MTSKKRGTDPWAKCRRGLGAFLLFLGLSALSATGRASTLDPVNLALNKPATQSNTAWGGDPSRAVDGDTNGDFNAGHVSHTWLSPHSWWQVDLGEVRQIGRIEIYNRTDCCMERIDPFMVIVADIPIIDSDITDEDANAYPGIMRTRVSGTKTLYSVPINRSGRFVRIALINETVLQLAEVKVFEAQNAALGRTASQSSTAGGATAARAVDGNVSGATAGASVAVTNVESRPYWQVDLGMVHFIRELHIWSSNAACCATANPRKGFNVRVSATPITGNPGTSASGMSNYYVATQGSPAVVPIDFPGQYVRIELDGTDSLSLSEVQVWAMATGSVGGHASQSSTQAGSGTASNAIDLNRSGLPAVTQTQTDPYWELDLGGMRNIDTIRVWAGESSSLWTYDVFVSNSAFTSTTVAGMRTQQGVTMWTTRGAFPYSTTAVIRKARFVRILLEGAQKAITDLREVEVMAGEGIVTSNTNGDRSLATTTGAMFSGVGYTSQPGVQVNVYAFQPAASGMGGGYPFLTSAISQTTPVLTNFSAAPLYPFNLGTFAYPAGLWPQGGVSGLYYEALENGGATPTPLRSSNANGGGENYFWPDIRALSITPSPDDSATKPPYFMSPMGPGHDDHYYDYTPFPNTIQDFRSLYYGSGADTSAAARFYNKNELGAGRDAHCARMLWPVPGKPTPKMASVCYVDTYAAGFAALPTYGDEATSLAGLRNGTGFVDTAVMLKWDDSPNTYFGAYRASDGFRTLRSPHDNVRYVDWVPNNCLSCHAGSGKAVLLPYDPFAYSYNVSPYAAADQVETFRKLNAVVWQSNPKPGVVDFINGTYPNGVLVAGSQPNPNYIPGGWNVTPAQRLVYNQVIKPYCRTCHMAQVPSEGGVDLLKADDADALRALVVMDVCKTYRMPHAQQPLKNFWYSSARAQLLGFFGRHDFDGETCKP